jgi:two-component system chemotaxis sensor kinase CheA
MTKGKDMHCNGISAGIVSDTLQLMQNIKDALLRLQQSPTDIAIANSIPGTAQAIKNMSDLGGCKDVAALLYAIETVLHRVRDAELRPKADLIALLQICCDHVSRMVSQLANGDEMYLGYLNRSHGLIRQLRAYHRNKLEYDAAA